MKIVIAGGGTAGHVEPALAVARAYKAAHPDATIIFIGTKTGLENTLVPQAGFHLSLIPKITLPRKLSFHIFTLPFTLLGAIVKTLQILQGAQLLVGFGGYVSAPAYLAAFVKRVPIVIHEANAKPGLANRLGSKLTHYCAITHYVSRGNLSKAQRTGLPMRPEIVHAFESASHNWQESRAAAKESLGFRRDEPLIFIFGGSQGSQSLNAVIAESVGGLTGRGINIVHGVGGSNPLPDSAPRYLPHHYIADMATAYLAADLIISRSGAVTCSEVAALGRYALFIPLPIGNGEQNLNAAELVAHSRAEIREQRDFTALWLIANIERLLRQSAAANISGSDQDMQATSKIVALMDDAISGGR